MTFSRICLLAGTVLLSACTMPTAKDTSSSPTPSANHGVADRVRAIQGALAHQGYDPGPIDGHYGPKTTAAIQSYQRDHGLPTDGRASPELLARLQGQKAAQSDQDQSKPASAFDLFHSINAGIRELEGDTQTTLQSTQGVVGAAKGVAQAAHDPKGSASAGSNQSGQGSSGPPGSNLPQNNAAGLQ